MALCGEYPKSLLEATDEAAPASPSFIRVFFSQIEFQLRQQSGGLSGQGAPPRVPGKQEYDVLQLPAGFPRRVCFNVDPSEFVVVVRDAGFSLLPGCEEEACFLPRGGGQGPSTQDFGGDEPLEATEPHDCCVEPPHEVHCAGMPRIHLQNQFELGQELTSLPDLGAAAFHVGPST